MDQDKMKPERSSSESKNSMKCQHRLQEHNYTNPPKNEGLISKSEATNDAHSTDTGDSQRVRNSTSRVGSTSQFKSDANHRQPVQPTSSISTDRQSVEVKKVIRKDVFNRIRRSEEELQKAAEMVRGGMTFQTASDTFNIPISTIRFYMARRGILPQRRRGRGSSGVRDDDLIHPPFEIIHYRLPDIDKPL